MRYTPPAFRQSLHPRVAARSTLPDPQARLAPVTEARSQGDDILFPASPARRSPGVDQTQSRTLSCPRGTTP